MRPDDDESRIWVMDTSAIIAVRELYSHDRPGMIKAYDLLTELVIQGRVTFHEKSLAELRRRHDRMDAPARWAADAFPLIIAPASGYVGIRRVMAEVPTLCDSKKTREDADPWIVAYALELCDLGLDIVIVSEDIRDTAQVLSIRSACHHFGIRFLHTGWFLRDIDAPEPQ